VTLRRQFAGARRVRGAGASGSTPPVAAAPLTDRSVCVSRTVHAAFVVTLLDIAYNWQTVGHVF
jgi:hypothetical protein